MRSSGMMFLVTLALPTQTPTDLSESLDALARSAANFAASAPGLMAEERLDQRGRRGFLDVIKGTIAKPKAIDVRLPIYCRCGLR